MKNIIILLILLTFRLFAQNNGVIMGEITDVKTGKPVSFANVVLLNTTLGNASDELGRYSIKGIAPGSYQVRVTLLGYTTVTKTDITVNNSKPTQVDFNLKEEALQLSNITVKAGYFQKDNFETGSISNFSYEEIRRSPGGFEDVIRALSVLPGVAQSSAGRNDLVVRGGAPSENLYLVDGFEIPNINHFGTQGATGGPLSFINLDFVKDASFSTGGFSSMYGDKVSSTLSINLRDGRKDKLGGKATIAASQFGLNLEGPVSENSSLIFSARRSYLDFIFKAAGFGFVPEYYDFLLKYDYDISKVYTLSIFSITALDNVKYFNDNADKKFENSRVLGSDMVTNVTGLSLRRLMTDGYMKLYLSRNTTDYNTIQNDSLLNPIFKNKSLEVEDKVKVEFVNHFSEAWEMTAGADAKYIHFDSDIKLPSFITSFKDTLPINAKQFNANFFKYSAYLNLNYSFTEKLNAILGGRADYFDAIKNKYTFSPRLSVNYDVSSLVSMSVSGGIYRQTPSYIWLAAGNSALDPIRVKQVVLSTEYKFRDDALMKVELYNKDYDKYPASSIRNYLILANTGAGYSGTEDNFSSFGFEPLLSAGKGRTYGVELSAQKKLSDIPCYGLASLTVNKSQFTALDGVTRTGSYDQTLIFNISGGYMFSPTLEASMKFRYATGSPYTPFDSKGMQYATQYNSERLKPLHSLDVRVDKRWFYEKYTLITYIDLQNVYGNKNASSAIWNARTQKVEMRESIGLLPSIGVSLEF